MWWPLLILFLVGQTSHAHSVTTRDVTDMKLVCYYTNWSVYRPGLAKFTPENINPFLCTHLIYAFAGFGKDYELKPLDSYNDIEQGNYRKFVGLKRHNKDLKTMIAIGGWNEGSRRFTKMVADTSTREKFIRGVIRFLRQHRFDGIEIDWEYPGSRDGSSSSDREGYALLIKELREAFNEQRGSRRKHTWILSVAVPAGKDYIDNGYDVSKISKYVDFLNVLSYDYHTAYEAVVNHHSPLYKSPDIGRWDERNNLNVNWTIGYYVGLGAPREKLVVGIPMYGRSFTLLDPFDNEIEASADGPGEEGEFTREKGYMAYHEICRNILDNDWEVRRPYPQLLGPYCFKGDQWVGFDDEMIITEKALYIREQGLGGAMVWTLDNDDFRGLCGEKENPLVSALRIVLLTGSKEPSMKSIVQKKIEEQQLLDRRLSPSNQFINDDKIDTSGLRSVLHTPKPPTTPDPGVGFVCTEEGFFRNPKSCKKYYWCLDSGPAELGILPNSFTCPAGLYFNQRTDSCDYSRNVRCEEERATTTTTRRPSRLTRRPVRIFRPRVRPKTRTTTTTTTTTTTEAPQTQIPTTDNLADLVRLLQSLLTSEQPNKEVTTTTTTTASPNVFSTSKTLPDYVTPRRIPRIDKKTKPVTTKSPSTSTETASKPRRIRYRRPNTHVSFLTATDLPHTTSERTPQLVNQVPRRPQFESDPDSEKLFQYVEPNRQRVKNKSGTVEDKGESLFIYKEPDRPQVSSPPPEVKTESLFIYKNPERATVVAPTNPPSKIEVTTEHKVTTVVNPFKYRNPARSFPLNVSFTKELSKEEEETRLQRLISQNRKNDGSGVRVRVRIRPLITSKESEDAVSSRVSSIALPQGEDLPDFKTIRRATRRHLRVRPLSSTTTEIRGPGVTVAESSKVLCIRQGVHRHPKDCNQFIVCAPQLEGKFTSFLYHCPPEKIFDEYLGRCMFGNKNTCEFTI